MLGRRRAEVVILMFFIILIALYIGPMDGFRHGHYYEEYDCSQIHKEDWGNRISLEDGDYEMEFSPKKDYLNGFSIFLCNQPNDNEGKLLVSIRNEKGKIIDVVSLDLNKICTEDWYKISLHTMLKKDKTYKLRFSVEDCKYYPSLQNVHRDYLPVETENGNILIAYAYAKSTFTKQERVMIVLFVVAICTFLAGFLMESKKKILWNASVIIFLVGILSWNYMNNTMDYYNTMFNKFQIDSETLAENKEKLHASSVNIANILPKGSAILLPEEYYCELRQYTGDILLTWSRYMDVNYNLNGEQQKYEYMQSVVRDIYENNNYDRIEEIKKELPMDYIGVYKNKGIEYLENNYEQVYSDGDITVFCLIQ